MTHPTRRDFTKAGAAGVLTALSARRVLGANDRIRLGFIGLGNRGDQVLDAFLVHKDAEVVAICDLYQPYLDFAAKKIGGSPKTTKNYHELLDMKDVDAVVICTPDHWHALQTIHACQAGKDVYVEKPLSLCVEEGRLMVEAARKHKRVTQVGLMRRSSAFCREACEFVRKGGIGQVTVARAFHIQNEWPKGIGNPPNEEEPKDFELGRVARAGPEGPLQQEPHLLPLPLVLRLLRRAIDQLRRPLPRPDPLGARPGRAAGGDGHGRQVRHRRQPRSARHAGSAVAVSRQHAGDVLAVQLQRRPGRRQRAARSSCAARRGRVYIQSNGWEVVPDALPDKEFPARTPVDRTVERGCRDGAKPVIEPQQGDGRQVRTRPTTPATSSTASCRASRATATSRPATATPRPP